MTLAQARAKLAPLGMVIKKTGFGRELYVNFKDGNEVTAYYTDDLNDAVSTGEAMAYHRDTGRNV